MTNFANDSWQSFCPEVYTWLEAIQPQNASDLVKAAHHIVAVNVKGENNGGLEIKAPSLAAPLKDKLLQAAKNHGWQGKGSSLKVYLEDKVFVLVTLSKIKTSSTQVGRQLGLDAAKALKEFTCDHLVFCAVDGLKLLDVYDGYTMGSYKGNMFKTYKKSENKKSLPEAVSFVGEKVDGKELKNRMELSKAVAFTRMLQDAPANWLNPVRFGDIAAEVAKDAKIKCTILKKIDLEELGMGSFLSVAAGSVMEPRLICLEVEGTNTSKTVTLVGKGLTFDSGGTSLKPSDGMGEMKYDMSGGAAVLGTLMYLGKVKPPVNVVGIIGAVENIIGGHATRPGDIVVAMNKKSIDVQNTDAEGRLVLADLLHYAVTKFKPNLMVDIATLTGAVLHALGHAGAAVMANNSATAQAVLDASKTAGEPFWELPMWPELDREVKSEISDLQNIAKPNVKAGTIIGGIFLKEFVGDTNWAHLDIAGTGWTCSATGFPGGGGSAYGLRTMSEVCLQYK